MYLLIPEMEPKNK